MAQLKDTTIDGFLKIKDSANDEELSVKEILLNLQQELQELKDKQPVLLFDRATPATGSMGGAITLSETSANFEYLEIYFGTNDTGEFGSVKLYKPNGKITALWYPRLAAGSYMYEKVKLVKVDGTSINTYIVGDTPLTAQIDIQGTTRNVTYEDNIAITRVLGYKA